MNKEVLIITKYKKGYVVLGNADPIKSTMIAMRAFYNKNLREKTIKGWILSDFNVEKFINLSSLINIIDLREFTLDEVLENFTDFNLNTSNTSNTCIDTQQIICTKMDHSDDFTINDTD